MPPVAPPPPLWCEWWDYDRLAPWCITPPIIVAVLLPVVARASGGRAPATVLALGAGASILAGVLSLGLAWLLLTTPFRKELRWSARGVKTCSLVHFNGDGGDWLQARVPRPAAQAYLERWATDPSLGECSLRAEGDALVLGCRQPKGDSDLTGVWAEGVLTMDASYW
ncbi:MAG: hypothetical protein FJ102_06030 [Deltaproteobacteria bacterium]|nr:hypothetical protein [Deltaproteobacteria bacterium]